MSNKSEFDAYRKSYAQTVNDSIAFSGLKMDFFTKAKASRLVSLLKENFSELAELSILDVGCGVGTYHPLLRGEVGQIAGIDLSRDCIEEAASNNPDVAYKHYSGTKFPFADKTFDVSFAVCVMHHVPPEQWTTFASEMARVTRKGGLVVVFEHNPYNPLTRRAVNTCPFDADAVLLTRKMTVKQLRDAGLTNVEGQYILTLPAIDGVALAVDKILGRFPFGAQYYVHGIST